MNAFLRMWVFAACAVIAAASVAAQDTDDDREGGILGTGIVGTVAALGSIYVNGQHIGFDTDLPLDPGVGLSTAGELRPGHTVAVIAEYSGNDTWQARHIRQALPLVGPVASVAEDRIVVFGTTVLAPGLTAGIVPDQWVAVSGLWRGEIVVASRLDTVPEHQREARISGTYLGAGDTGTITIGGTGIRGLTVRNLRSGDVVRVSGVPDNDAIIARRLERHVFSAEVGVMLVEGYFSAPQPDGLYTVLGSGLVAFTDRPEMIDTSRPVLRCGQDGSLGPVTVPQDPDGARDPSEALQPWCAPADR